MDLSNIQCIALANEELITEEDFTNFKENQLKTMFKNNQSSIPSIPRVLTIPQ